MPYYAWTEWSTLSQAKDQELLKCKRLVLQWGEGRVGDIYTPQEPCKETSIQSSVLGDCISVLFAVHGSELQQQSWLLAEGRRVLFWEQAVPRQSRSRRGWAAEARRHIPTPSAAASVKLCWRQDLTVLSPEAEFTQDWKQASAEAEVKCN